MELEKYLSELEEQEVQEESEIQVVSYPILDVLFEKYEQWLNEKEMYDDASHLVEKLNYSSKDVTEFSLQMKTYEGHEWFFRSGEFLSTLINKSSEENFEIITQHLRCLSDFCCNYNEKNVIVFGSAGDYCGQEIKKGVVTVKGNVGAEAGFFMYAGKLVIEGNAGTDLGLYSQGGEIYVSGEIKSIGDGCKARIYQRNKLVWPTP